MVVVGVWRLLNGVSKCWFPCIRKEMQDYALIIALILHVILRILNNRIKAYLYKQIQPKQVEFMPGRGTREQTTNVRLVMCFIDCARAFDSVNWKKIFKVLREMRIPTHTVDLVESLHELYSMVARVDGEKSSWCFLSGTGDASRMYIILAVIQQL